MANYSSTAFVSRRSGSASIVRERLLQDDQMRRNRPDYMSTSSNIIAPITATFADLDLTELPCLSAAEQKQRALQVAKSYKSYYLAEYSYREDQRLAVAMIRPRGNPDSFQRICVDAGGNVSILTDDSPFPHRLILSRVAVVLSGLLAATGTLMWIILS